MMRVKSAVLCDCGCGKTLEDVERAWEAAYSWRDRRAQVNDEQAEADMGLDRAVELPGDVPREMSIRTRRRAPSSGTFLMLVGMLAGSFLVIGFLLATWPLGHLPPGCTP